MNLAFGAQRIEYAPLEGDASVRMIVPRAPDFAVELHKLSSAGHVDRIAQVLPYAVILKNKSSERVISFVVRYQIENDRGRVIAHIQEYQHTLGPEKTFFICPVRMLNRLITYGKLPPF
ncbi:MAG TPA: hypothetical protein VMZ52_11595, partial [Bryobacteraceae bacterium]|nr:hypothetical protein [Bryobacteraceae bacterium]